MAVNGWQLCARRARRAPRSPPIRGRCLVALRARQGTKCSFFTEVCGSALEQRRPSWTVAESSSEYSDLFLRFACSGLCFDWTITSVERRFRHASPLRPDIRPTSRLFLHFSQITRRCLVGKTLEPKRCRSRKGVGAGKMSESERHRGRNGIGVGKASGPKRCRSRNDIGTEKTPKKAKRAAPPAHPSGARSPFSSPLAYGIARADPRNQERVMRMADSWKRLRTLACRRSPRA